MPCNAVNSRPGYPVFDVFSGAYDHVSKRGLLDKNPDWHAGHQ